MSKLGIILLFLGVLTSVCVFAQSKAVELPMKFRDGEPVIEVTVNGQGPFLFAIDTGGQGELRADISLVEKLGLKKVGEVIVGDPSGKNNQTNDVVGIESLKIGDLEFHNLEAGTRDYNRRPGMKIDGILCFELFKDYLLTLDYPAKLVRIEQGNLPEANGKDILSFENPRGIPVVKLGVGNQTIDTHIDSGNANGGFVFPTERIEKLQLASEPRVVGTARTVSNTFEIKEVKIKDSIRFGGFEYSEPTIVYPGPSPKLANIGAKILQDFVLTFDQKNKRLKLAKTNGTAEIISGELGNRLDTLFSEDEKKGFHGVILFEQNGNVVLSKGYGFANEAIKMKFSPSTLVQIGSNVKDLTKIAVYQLVESGKLKLSDPLSNFMPGLTGDKQKITVEHLLEHQAGFPLGVRGDEYPFTTEEFIKSIQTLELKSEPGTKENYSNLGYACLAYIIGKVSGQTFDKYVFENILKPLGMLETGSYLPNFDKNRIAHGYGYNGDIGIILNQPHDADGHLWSLRGNGGYLSTTGDMIKLYKALLNDSLLKDETHRKAVFNPSEPAVLAGSDMVSFFLFTNMPRLNSQMIIASNHAAYKGNKLMQEVSSLLQSSTGDNSAGKIETQIETGDGGKPKTKTLKPLLDKLPQSGAGLTIRKYIEAYNSGDEEKMKAFLMEYAKNNPDSPPLEKRLQNYKNIRGKLGKITFINYGFSEDGGWEVNMSAEGEPQVKFTFHIEPNSPWHFEGLMVTVDK